MSRGQAPAAAISMTVQQRSILEGIANKHQTGQQLAKRIRIVLLANEGKSNSSVKRTVGVSLNTVKRWRKRWKAAYASLVCYEESQEAADFSLSVYEEKLLSVLADAARSGSPKRIGLDQEQQIVALACEKPEDYGLPHTSWSDKLLQQVAIDKQIIDKISVRQVGRILKK